MFLLSTAGTTTSVGDCPQMLEPTLPACRECLQICNPKEQPLARCSRANSPSPDPWVGWHSWMCTPPCPQNSTVALLGNTYKDHLHQGSSDLGEKNHLHKGLCLQAPSGKPDLHKTMFLKLLTEMSILLEVMPFVLQPNRSHMQYCHQNDDHRR